jgi:hypothetical protein
MVVEDGGRVHLAGVRACFCFAKSGCVVMTNGRTVEGGPWL